MDLDASDDQLDCPFVYASAQIRNCRTGIFPMKKKTCSRSLRRFWNTFLLEGDPEAPTQMLISTIDYNEYVGRIGVGK